MKRRRTLHSTGKCVLRINVKNTEQFPCGVNSLPTAVPAAHCDCVCPITAQKRTCVKCSYCRPSCFSISSKLWQLHNLIFERFHFILHFQLVSAWVARWVGIDFAVARNFSKWIGNYVEQVNGDAPSSLLRFHLARCNLFRFGYCCIVYDVMWSSELVRRAGNKQTTQNAGKQCSKVESWRRWRWLLCEQVDDAEEGGCNERTEWKGKPFDFHLFLHRMCAFVHIFSQM